LTTRPRRKESQARVARRGMVIEAAVRLFAEKGYRATSVEDIMASLDSTGAAFYYYFKSKEKVLAAIFDEAMGHVERELAEVLSLELSPPEALERVIATHARVIAENLHLSVVMFQDLRAVSPSLAREVTQRERKYTHAIREVYLTGVANGTLISTDPELVVDALLGMANSIYRWYQPWRHPDPKAIGDLIGRLAIRSVSVNPPEPPGPRDRLGR
jgi:TetR/AcrR family transcriptional regulator, cholesterol catabolism regulator